MNYQHIMNLAIKRRATLIKQIEKARAEYNDSRCDQIMMRLQGENQIIGDCRQQLGIR
jgi:hypothetical protein